MISVFVYIYKNHLQFDIINIIIVNKFVLDRVLTALYLKRYFEAISSRAAWSSYDLWPLQWVASRNAAVRYHFYIIKKLKLIEIELLIKSYFTFDF